MALFIKNVKRAKDLLIGAASCLQDVLDKNDPKPSKEWLESLEAAVTDASTAAKLLNAEIEDLYEDNVNEACPSRDTTPGAKHFYKHGICVFCGEKKCS